jgi:hypothetical protein
VLYVCNVRQLLDELGAQPSSEPSESSLRQESSTAQCSLGRAFNKQIQDILKMIRSRDLLWLAGGIVAGAALAASLPKLRRQFGPVFEEATKHAGDVFSTMAEAVAVQMERTEDHMAERRAAS